MSPIKLFFHYSKGLLRFMWRLSGACVSAISMLVLTAAPTLGDTCREQGVACFGEQIYVGWDRAAEVSVSDGKSVFESVVIGALFDGTVEIKEFGHVVANSLLIGLWGDGSLSIVSGGVVEVPDGGEIILGVAKPGTINIGGEKGSAPISAGELQAGRIAFGPSAGAIVFNHLGASIDFAANVSGQGGDLLLESGNTNISGDLSAFSGSLIVGGGQHDRSASLSLARGFPMIDDIEIGGSLTVKKGGLLKINVNADGGSERLKVGGSVTLTGGLQVIPQGSPSEYGAPGANHKYIVMVYSPDNLAGEFTHIDTGFLDLVEVNYLDVDQEGRHRVTVVLKLDRPSFILDAFTKDALAIAQAIELFDYSLPGGAGVLEALRGLSDLERSEALVQIGGFGQAEVSRQSEVAVNLFLGSVLNRLSRTRPLLDVGSLTVSTSNAEMQNGFRSDRAWVAAFADRYAGTGGGSSPAVNSETTGIALGADATLDSGIRLGATLGFTNSKIFSGNVSAKSQGSHLGIYGAVGPAAPSEVGLGFRGALLASSITVQSTRSLSFGGLVGAAEANYQGFAFGAEAKVRYGARGNSGDSVVAPFMGIRYSNFYSEGYAETGAPSLNFHASPTRSERVTAIVGVETAGSTPSRLGNVHHTASVSLEKALLSSSFERILMLEASSAPVTLSSRQHDGYGIKVAGNLLFDFSSNATLELGGVVDVTRQAWQVNGVLSYKF